MDFNFPLILVILTAVTGALWLYDVLFLKKNRLQKAAHLEKDSQAQRAALKEPLLVEYGKSFFPVILAVLLLRSFLVEPFKIPSSSMMPTLLVGDFILVNKFAYGIRLPVINKKIIDVGDPQRGDIFVFRYPHNPSIDYIKRLVGVPGDRIAYQNKTLYVNGKPQAKTFIGKYDAVGGGSRYDGFGLFEEHLQLEQGGYKTHDVLINPMSDDFGPGCGQLRNRTIVIPDGYYFAMGDNRDGSSDSRCWGFVPEDNLVGKAFAIWMNWDGAKPGFPVDWSRLGTVLE
ncbi:MAG: signal peptidase I [gamma proteobacterium symbiont of Bathyaustriella thionipta]|nr:signal peptidase I [gamma proteobacterium symbiont of Bathyaustriella thionipta]